MLEMIRNAIEMASSAAEVPRKQARRFAKELSRMGEVRASQVSGLAEDIVKRSRQNAEMVRTLITSEIRRQIRILGLATSQDLERLARRVRQLESKSAAPRRKRTVKPKPKTQ